MRTRLIIEIPPKDDANRRPPSAAGLGPDTRAKDRAIASEWDASGAAFRRILSRKLGLLLVPVLAAWTTMGRIPRALRKAACSGEG